MSSRGNSTAGIQDHTRPLKQWHQGFIVCGHGLVPFAHKETAERVAAQAERAVEQAMEVVPHEDHWGYRPVEP